MPELLGSEKTLIKEQSAPVCGECTRFDHEDASGNGYCPLLDLLLRCNTRNCGLFFKPITEA